MSHPTPESQSQPQPPVLPQQQERPSLSRETQRTEALRAQADAQHALGFRGRLI